MYTSGRRAYQRFVLDGIGEGHKDEYYEVEDQRFLGPEGFGEKLTNRLDNEEEFVKPQKPLKAVLGVLAQRLQVDRAVLREADRSWPASRNRAVVSYVLVRRLGYRLGEVASSLGRDAATVSSLMSRLAKRMENDKQLREEIDRLTRISKN